MVFMFNLNGCSILPYNDEFSECILACGAAFRFAKDFMTHEFHPAFVVIHNDKISCFDNFSSAQAFYKEIA